uniref:Uncharacterized protein n=1 Tax=Anguilla anguilla TaxID=7936 RepID=A0A0E9U7P5_ANGAN
MYLVSYTLHEPVAFKIISMLSQTFPLGFIFS